jgi:anti-sigma factor RsiW
VTCNWCEERFERFIDGLVTDAERTRLLAHVDTCAACSGLLEELRVVDALLIQPSAFDLPPNFTHATMAEVRALPEPACRRGSVLLASLVSFLVAAWALIGAEFIFAPQTMTALRETSMDVARTVLDAIAGIGHVFVHLVSRGDVSSLFTVAGSVVIADCLALVVIIAGVRFARPRIAERLHW